MPGLGYNKQVGYFDQTTGEPIMPGDPRLAYAGYNMELAMDASTVGDDAFMFPDGGDTGSGGPPEQAIALGVRLSELMAKIGPWIATSLAWAFKGAKTGTKLNWSSLPGPVQEAMKIAGFMVGTEVILDTITNAGPLDVYRGDNPPGILGVGGGVGGLGVAVAKTWTANGAVFYMLTDGRIAVQRKSGTWKVYRPPRPIVLYPDGARNRTVAKRAARALRRDMRDSAVMLRGFGYDVQRRGRSCGGCGKSRCTCKK